MKRFFLIFVSVILVAGCNESKKAVEYYKLVINEQNQIRQIYEKFIYSFSNDNLERTEELRHQAIKQVDKSIEKMYEMSDYRGSNELKVAAIELFQFYKNSLEQEYPPIINLLKQSKGELTKEELKQTNSKLEKMQERYVAVNEVFLQAQKKFAEENNFEFSQEETK